MTGYPSCAKQQGEIITFLLISGNGNPDGNFYTFLLEPEHCLHKFCETNESSDFNRRFPRLSHCVLSIFNPATKNTRVAQLYGRNRLTNQNHFVFHCLS